MAVIVALGFFLLNENKSVSKKKEEKQEEAKQEETTKVEAPLLKDGDEVVIVENGKREKGVVKLMPQGLQVWDEDGNLRLDVTDKLTRGIALIEVKQNNSISIKDGSAKVVYTKIEPDYSTHVEQLVQLDIEVSFTEGRKVWAAISGGILGQRFYTAINIKKIKNGLAEISIIDNGGIVGLGADRAFVFIGEV